MAKTADPTKPEFYVYTLQVRGVPFYVGEGRSSRASDRVRYVRYLMNREAAGKPVKWVFSNRVVAEFLRCGEEVSVAYPVQGLTRPEALRRELDEIRNLLTEGFVLANEQHNPCRPVTVEQLVQAVLARAEVLLR